MFDELVRNLKLQFPFAANEAVRIHRCDHDELLVIFEDGSRMMYDDHEKSLRRLPRDSNDMSEQECRRELGIRLRKMMARKCITQIELSEETGIQQCMISNYITGRNTPSFYVMDRIAKCLECSIDEFRLVE